MSTWTVGDLDVHVIACPAVRRLTRARGSGHDPQAPLYFGLSGTSSGNRSCGGPSNALREFSSPATGGSVGPSVHVGTFTARTESHGRPSFEATKEATNAATAASEVGRAGDPVRFSRGAW